MNPTSAFTGDAKLKQSVLLLAQASALEKAGNVAQAVQVYQQAIRLYPQNAAGYQALTSLLLGLGDIANAEKVIQAVPAALYQSSKPLQLQHARILIHQAHYERAIPVLAALERAPEVDQGFLNFNLGICHNFRGEFETALHYYKRAYQTGLRQPWLYENWARIYQLQGDVPAAEKLYAEAAARYPGSSTLLYEYALFLLKNEKYQDGFRLYRHRWQTGLPEFEQLKPTSLGLPSWDGKSRSRSLLVVKEQGVGDQIVCSALLPALAEKVDTLSVAFDPRLAPLLARSYPRLNIVTDDLVPAALQKNHDACLPAADMGMHVPEAVGWTHDYLQPDRARAAALREKYRQLFPGKQLIGISWQSKRAALGAAKSVDLLAWRRILELGQCQFVSLQYGNVDAELEAVRDALGIEVYRDPDIDSFNDLDSLAAQINALDRVITTSNTTAHLAAATAAPTWVILPIGSGLLWYWGYREHESRWYPQCRLFRATQPDDWAPVLDAVFDALNATLQETR
jgi:tetratricopeptide (TPR) repeat protein